MTDPTIEEIRKGLSTTMKKALKVAVVTGSTFYGRGAIFGHRTGRALKRRGLIEVAYPDREYGPFDRRPVIFRPTDMGKAVIKAMEADGWRCSMRGFGTPS